MKKLCLALLVVALLSSVSFAKAGNFGLEYLNMIGGPDALGGMSGMLGFEMGIPLLTPLQKIGFVYDVTDNLVVHGGLAQTNITLGTMAGSDSGARAAGTGIGLGAKWRLAKGNLVPVIGANIFLFQASLDDDAFPFDSINGSIINASVGFEYSIISNLLLIGDANVLTMSSGSITNSGGTVTINNTTSLFGGASLGLRWYVI